MGKRTGQLSTARVVAAALAAEPPDTKSGLLAWRLGQDEIVTEAGDASRGTLTAVVRALRQSGWLIETTRARNGAQTSYRVTLRGGIGAVLAEPPAPKPARRRRQPQPIEQPSNRREPLRFGTSATEQLQPPAPALGVSLRVTMVAEAGDGIAAALVDPAGVVWLAQIEREQ